MRLSAERISYAAGNFRLGPLTLETAGPMLVVVTGASGSGKSTLLRLLAGCASPDAGILRYDDRPLPDAERARAQARLAGIAYAAQTPLFFRDKSIRENLAYALRLRGITAKAGALADVDAALSAAGIAAAADRLPATLSGGELARANVARSLIGNRPLVLVDEPTATLDPATASAINARLIAESRHRLVIAATHDDGLVAAAARNWRLDAGRLVDAAP